MLATACAPFRYARLGSKTEKEQIPGQAASTAKCKTVTLSKYVHPHTRMNKGEREGAHQGRCDPEGSGSKRKACNKARAHKREKQREKGYVTRVRLARQALQYHGYSKCFISARQRATRGM